MIEQMSFVFGRGASEKSLDAAQFGDQRSRQRAALLRLCGVGEHRVIKGAGGTCILIRHQIAFHDQRADMAWLLCQHLIQRAMRSLAIVQPATGMRQRELRFGSRAIANPFKQLARRRHVAATECRNSFCEKACPIIRFNHRETIALRPVAGIALSGDNGGSADYRPRET